MSDQSQVKQEQAPRRRGRGCLLWLGRGTALILGLVLAGAIYETASEAADARNYPPPGQMVDVGGYRLHINCTGAGSPTVVIDAGWGDWSVSWSLVQAGVEKSTRVCTYDRAGMGYSEAGPLPRDAKQFAKELHILLQRANISGPYVLVGHSLGGLPVRLFAHDYPSEVTGVVLIESMNPAQSTQTLEERAAGPAAQSGSPSIAALVARIGVMRLFTGPKDAYTAYSVTPRSMQAVIDEGTGMPSSFAQAGAVKTFGDLPLIVLSRGLDKQPDWQEWQSELLQLSTDSQQLTADRSGHNIEREQPEAAIDAILKMVGQLREVKAKQITTLVELLRCKDARLSGLAPGGRTRDHDWATQVRDLRRPDSL